MAKTKSASGKTKAVQKVTGSQKVRDYFARHGLDAKQADVARATGVAPSQVSQIHKKLTGSAGPKSTAGRKGKKVDTANGHHAHSASEFIKAAFAIGLDKAIHTLTAVKKAIE